MNAPPDLARDVSHAAAKSAPPLVIWLSGLGLNDVLAIVSILYVVAQFAFLLWRWRRMIRRRVSDDA